MPSTSTPVAIGSSVPACPTLRVPARRRIRATTSWLVQPAGLSTTTSPSGAVGRRTRSDTGAVVVVLVLVRVLGRLAVRVGVAGELGGRRERRDLRVPTGRLRQRRGQVSSGLRDRVEVEVERRRQPHARLLADLGADEALGALECSRGTGARLVVAVDGVEDVRVLQVAGHPDIGDGDEPEPRVLDPGVEHLRDDLLDPLGELPRTTLVCHVLRPSGRSAPACGTGDRCRRPEALDTDDRTTGGGPCRPARATSSHVVTCEASRASPTSR